MLWLLGLWRLTGWVAVHALWKTALVMAALWAIFRLVPVRTTQLRARVAAVAVFLTLALVAADVAQFTLDWQVHTSCWEHGAKAGASSACASHGVPKASSSLPPASGRTTLTMTFLTGVRGDRADVPLVLRLAALSTPLLGLAGVVWMAWLVALAVRAVGTSLELRRIRRRSGPLRDPRIERGVDELRAALQVTQRVEVRESVDVAGPCLMPGRQPLVLLPRGLADACTEAELRAVLAHELAHVSRNDAITAPLCSLALAVLPPSPFATALRRNVRSEREADCDRMALRVTRSVPIDYARTLLLVEGFCAARTTHHCLLALSGPPLMDRIRRVVDHPAGQTNRLAYKLAALVLVGAATALLFGFTRQGNAIAEWAVMSHDMTARGAPVTLSD
jgi:beta-lactamase regulating signal transducer with metallopeptidase domain